MFVVCFLIPINRRIIIVMNTLEYNFRCIVQISRVLNLTPNAECRLCPERVSASQVSHQLVGSLWCRLRRKLRVGIGNAVTKPTVASALVFYVGVVFKRGVIHDDKTRNCTRKIVSFLRTRTHESTNIVQCSGSYRNRIVLTVRLGKAEYRTQNKINV